MSSNPFEVGLAEWQPASWACTGRSNCGKCGSPSRQLHRRDCLTSDGEWQEGSTMEALAFAVHHKLDSRVGSEFLALDSAPEWRRRLLYLSAIGRPWARMTDS
jgi:hypothetical protein